MLTAAPLPTWLNLFRALLRPPPPDEILAAPWCRVGDVGGWLSRSAWSLALIAAWRRSRTPDKPVTVWVPDFFCDSALVALRRTGARLVFYSLTDTLSPDMAACRAMFELAPPDLFLLVHYFGQPAAAAAARDLCARCGAWLIEDAAHVLRPVEGVGGYGDFVLYSPHKHLAIPDGAVLVVRNRGPARLAPDLIASFGAPASWPGRLETLQQALGCSTSSIYRQALTWLLKRVLQKLGVRRAALPPVEFPEASASAAASTVKLAAPAQSAVARRLLAGLVGELADVARRRERSQLLWDTLLLGQTHSVPFRLSAADRPVGRDWTPYLCAYQADTETAEAAYERWRLEGLPAMTWPDLPPEVMADRGRHENAWRLRHNRVYLPVHQSLDVAGMLKHARQPKVAAEEGPDLKLVWDRATAAQWHEWLTQAGRSSLLQSWAYGAAKADSSGWKVTRAVVFAGEEPIALVQALHRRIAGLLGILRINRGPIYLRPLLPQEERAVWTELGRLGSLRHGRLVSAAPELSLSGASLALLVRLGFRQFSVRAWESAWIDLALEPDILRKRLDGKWRNMLVAAEKSGLELEIGSDDRLFHWMVARYRELMLAKNFTGVPLGVLLALRKHLDADSQLVVLRAVAAGEPVAGVCLVTHGNAATYLLGWNGVQGRNLKANQYLLWQSILYLKQRGLRWLDLGGFSEERAPGIAAFKLGINGERYESVGEFWKC